MLLGCHPVVNQIVAQRHVIRGRHVCAAGIGRRIGATEQAVQAHFRLRRGGNERREVIETRLVRGRHRTVGLRRVGAHPGEITRRDQRVEICARWIMADDQFGHAAARVGARRKHGVGKVGSAVTAGRVIRINRDEIFHRRTGFVEISGERALQVRDGQPHFKGIGRLAAQLRPVAATEQNARMAKRPRIRRKLPHGSRRRDVRIEPDLMVRIQSPNAVPDIDPDITRGGIDTVGRRDLKLVNPRRRQRHNHLV